MFPWGHLAVGYLFYTAFTRLVNRRPPEGPPTIALAVGTQLPDLVDKPANWWVGILDGRGIGHSLLVVVPLCALVVALARRRDRPAVGAALSIGLVTHLLGDAWRAVLAGEVQASASYLLWPLWEAPTYAIDSPWGHLGSWLATVRLLRWSSLGDLLASGFGVQLAALLLVVTVWAVDGFPGVGLLWRRVAGVVGSSSRWPRSS